MKIRINPRYETLRPFVEKLADPLFFDRHGETLQSGRNIVKRFEVGGIPLVVKSYVRMTLCNRILYSTVRKSKAMRAYLHAERLRNLGIDTPEEVAVVEVRRRGVLRQSCFVSLCSDYRPLRPVIERFLQGSDSKPILDSVAEFLNRMHWAGVLHEDLNVGNILYREGPSGKYLFCVIDTNRMSFHRHLSMRQRLKNMRRLTCGTPAYLYILQRYAEILHEDTESVQLKGVFSKLLFERRQRTKWKIKDLFRRK